MAVTGGYFGMRWSFYILRGLLNIGAKLQLTYLGTRETHGHVMENVTERNLEPKLINHTSHENVHFGKVGACNEL